MFNQNFTRLLHVHIYAKLQNFIKLSPTLKMLCRIKRGHAMNFYILLQDWLRVSRTDFIAKDQWPSKSPDLNPLDYHVWGAMLQAFHKLHPKPKTITELKNTLQQIWDDLPLTTINKVINTVINDFRKRLNECVSVGGGHFEHTM